MMHQEVSRNNGELSFAISQRNNVSTAMVQHLIDISLTFLLQYRQAGLCCKEESRDFDVCMKDLPQNKK